MLFLFAAFWISKRQHLGPSYEAQSDVTPCLHVSHGAMVAGAKENGIGSTSSTDLLARVRGQAADCRRRSREGEGW